jgi:cyclic beta-1,2-glucan synthetase
VPAHWPGFEITLRLEGRTLRLHHGADDVPEGAVMVAIGEKVRWRELPDGAVLHIG